MSECNHNCSSCGQDCSSRTQEPIVPTSDTKIKKIIGVLSGKGGVGKSMVSSLLAIELAEKGYKVGIMDADITGPSIPKMFGLHNQLYGDEEGIFPAVTTLGIKVVSINMMLENEDDAVLWRGPILGGLINALARSSRAVAAVSRSPPRGSKHLWFSLVSFPRGIPTGLSHVHTWWESILGLNVKAVQGKQIGRAHV